MSTVVSVTGCTPDLVSYCPRCGNPEICFHPVSRAYDCGHCGGEYYIVEGENSRPDEEYEEAATCRE